MRPFFSLPHRTRMSRGLRGARRGAEARRKAGRHERSKDIVEMKGTERNGSRRGGRGSGQWAVGRGAWGRGEQLEKPSRRRGEWVGKKATGEFRVSPKCTGPAPAARGSPGRAPPSPAMYLTVYLRGASTARLLWRPTSRLLWRPEARTRRGAPRRASRRAPTGWPPPCILRRSTPPLYRPQYVQKCLTRP